MRRLAKFICNKLLFKNDIDNYKKIDITEKIIFNICVLLLLSLYCIIFESIINVLILSVSFIIYNLIFGLFKIKQNYLKLIILIITIFIQILVPTDEIANTFAFWVSILCLFPIILLTPINCINIRFISVNNKTNKVIFNIISILLSAGLLIISVCNRLYKLDLIYLSDIAIGLLINTILLIIESIIIYKHNKT